MGDASVECGVSSAKIVGKQPKVILAWRTLVPWHREQACVDLDLPFFFRNNQTPVTNGFPLTVGLTSLYYLKVSWVYLHFSSLNHKTCSCQSSPRPPLWWGLVPTVAPRVWVAACLSCGNSLFSILQGMCAPANHEEADKILSSVLSACHSPQSVGGY